MVQAITKEGYNSIIERLDKYIAERHIIAEEIADARSKGDLSENAEYHAAKAKQEALERKIAELNYVISTSEVINISSINSDTVGFGATVHLFETEKKKNYIYKIVGPYEADVSKGLISIEANLAAELLGKK
uniref:Transcription elongation factor GreA n=1 Tax=Biomphalaria glabrata TaxID=6526 RepID=A0A2C9LQA6_BIOGL